MTEHPPSTGSTDTQSPVEPDPPEVGHSTTVAHKLEAVATELVRRGWPVAPIDYTAPDLVLTGRLVEEERRLRAAIEAGT